MAETLNYSFPTDHLNHAKVKKNKVNKRKSMTRMHIIIPGICNIEHDTAKKKYMSK